MSLEQYEISFMLDGLHQFRFQGHHEQARAIRQAMIQDSKASSVDVGDIQVYPVGGSHKGGAQELVDDLVSALWLSEEDQAEQGIEALLGLARQVDSQAREISDQSHLVEFVWNNGGGDDNPFGQSFQVNSQHAETAEQFSDALEAWLVDHDHGYDYSCGAETDKHPLLSLEDAVEATIEVFEDKAIATSQLSTFMDARKLDDATPLAQARKPRRTL